MATKKRTPVKDAASKRATVKKATTKKAKAAEEEVDDQEEFPENQTPEPPAPPQDLPEARGKKAPPKKRKGKGKEADLKSFVEDGLIEFNASDEFRRRFQKVHEALGHDDILQTLTEVFAAGLNVVEAKGRPSSGNLVDDAGYEEPYGEDFNEAFGIQILGQVGT